MTQLPSNNNPLKEPAAPATAGPDTRKRSSGWLSQHLKSVFIGGLLALIPLFVTIYILRLLFLAATGFFYPTVQDWLGNVQVQHWTHIHNATAIAVMAAFVSLLVFLGVVYLIGVLGSFVIGRQLLNAFDHFVENLPLLKGIYSTTKQVIGSFRKEGSKGYERVVLVEFPRVGIWTIAFVTNTVTDSCCGKRYLTVFIPMTPNPTSGFFQFVPEEDVRNTDWTKEQAITIVLSGGLMAPAEMNFGPAGKVSEAGTATIELAGPAPGEQAASQQPGV